MNDTLLPQGHSLLLCRDQGPALPTLSPMEPRARPSAVFSTLKRPAKRGNPSLSSRLDQRGAVGTIGRKRTLFIWFYFFPIFLLLFFFDTVLNFGSWQHWGERSVQKLQEQKTMKRKGQNIANVGTRRPLNFSLMAVKIYKFEKTRFGKWQM